MEKIDDRDVSNIPFYTLIVNASKQDRDKIAETIHWITDFIHKEVRIHAIQREVDELHYSSTHEIYIPSFVLRNREEVLDWVSEYKKINPERNVFIIPIIIVESRVWNNQEDKAELEKAPYAIYIFKKSSTFCFCFSNSYERRKDNQDFLDKLLIHLYEYRNTKAGIKIPSMENEDENDPDYVKMRNRIKRIEERNLSNKRKEHIMPSHSVGSEIEIQPFMTQSLDKAKIEAVKTEVRSNSNFSEGLSGSDADSIMRDDGNMFKSDKSGGSHRK